MTNEPSRGRPAPELLAPAGNWECIQAAIENGADAVYFGLDVGFNARARATNFSLDDLEPLMRTLHRRGVLGYVTLNTLIFTDELSAFEKNVGLLAKAGVDAVLVQDLGAVRLIREICPELSIHASTQMTMVSAETIAAIESLGIERVVLARELSIDEIRKITSSTKMPVETFIHGALCVAYSGQCLTSESLGGRSANRGQCAQACRLNYDLICDGQDVDLGDNRYLLSPQDLAGYAHVPQLIDAGVCSLKIEGRLKTPEYVANIVGHYRKAIDAAVQGREIVWSGDSRREMELSFSRGFSPGWLEGCNHKRLVPGLSSAKRGVRVGTVIGVRGERVMAQLEHELMPGDGVVFEGDRIAGDEIGGRIYQVFVNGKLSETPQSGRVELAFQRGLIEPDFVTPGLGIWQTDSPQLTKRLRATFDSKQPIRKKPIWMEIHVETGKPVECRAGVLPRDDGTATTWVHEFVPEVARKHSVSSESLHEQFNRLGNTQFVLNEFDARIVGNPMLPLSVLGEIRKELIAHLDDIMVVRSPRTVSAYGVVDRMISEAKKRTESVAMDVGVERNRAGEGDYAPQLHVLVRSLSQLESVISTGQASVYADFHDIREYARAVEVCREAKAKIFLATLRIQKPGEMGLFKALEKRNADGWLVRNLAALDYARKAQIPFVCDFSLNATNPLTAEWLIQNGAMRFTASYDLNRDQLTELVDGVCPGSVEIVVHQHMPMFHMEHCVFCTVLSPGTNKSNCGRPCDRHDVKLRDRIGMEHVLHADIGCRNTLYNGQAQSGAEAVAGLIKKSVVHFRIELLRDASPQEIGEIVTSYRSLLTGELNGSDVWKRLKAANRVGVTRGTLEHPRNPLAIL
ncbi:MAG: U32 family peptidase [Pirellula sp.]|nr:U32 family peptidase [Pirellula sp.]